MPTLQLYIIPVIGHYINEPSVAARNEATCARIGLEGSCRGHDLEGFDGDAGRQEDGVDQRLCDGFRRHHFSARGLRPQSVPDVGIDGAGEKSDDADAARAEFFAKRIGKAEGGVLGCGVGGGSGEDAMSGDGEIVHNRGAALHHGQSGLSDQEGSIKVRGQNIFPDRIGKLIHRQVGVGDAGIVDEEVKPREVAAQGAEKGINRVGVADVAGPGEDAEFRAGQFPADAGQSFCVTGGEDQVAMFGGESAGDGESDAPGGPGDQRDLAVETGWFGSAWQASYFTACGGLSDSRQTPRFFAFDCLSVRE